MSVRDWSTLQRMNAVFGPLCLLGLIAILLLKFSPVPYCPIGLLLGAWCLWAGFIDRRWQRWGVNLSVAMVTLAIAELLIEPRRPVTSRYQSLDAPGLSHVQNDELLGTVPRSHSRSRHTVVAHGQTVIDAIYTVDDQSLRLMPQGSPEEKSRETVVFLGCSFTYGEGVGDDETLPARVALCRPRWRVLNFGFSGYGPHHMLANLESGRVARVCGENPRIAIFQMIPGHVQRVAGWAPVRPDAPRYGWQGGEVRRLGRLDDRRVLLTVKRLLWKSRIFSELIAPHIVSQADVDLTVAILQRSAREVARQFPGCEFHVLLWTLPEDPFSPRVRTALQKSGLKLHLVEDFAPEVQQPEDFRYRIPFDSHPTALAHQRLADYVCREILPPTEPPAGVTP